MSGELHTEAQVYMALDDACKAAGGQKAWGERHDISPQQVSDVLSARRPLTGRILLALGYSALPVRRYAKIRIPNR